MTCTPIARDERCMCRFLDAASSDVTHASIERERHAGDEDCHHRNRRSVAKRPRAVLERDAVSSLRELDRTYDEVRPQYWGVPVVDARSPPWIIAVGQDEVSGIGDVGDRDAPIL